MTRWLTLVEIDAHTGDLGSYGAAYGLGARPIGALVPAGGMPGAAVTLRVADREYTSRAGDSIGVKAYRGLLRQGLRVEREIPLDPAATGVGAAWGELGIADPDGTWAALMQTHAVDGRAVRLRRGAFAHDAARGLPLDPGYDGTVELFRGVALDWVLAEDGLRLPIRDRSYRIETPLQPRTYAGTGGLDGGAALAGRPLPRTRGTPRNVRPVLVDEAARIWQFSDGPGGIEAGPFERGLGGFTDEGDVPDLHAGSTSVGAFRTDNARGLFQLGREPVGEITVDAAGAFPTGGLQTTAAALARWTLQDDLGLGASVLDTAAFDALDAACPYPAGLYVPEGASAPEIVGLLLRSVGAVLLPARDSRLRPYRLTAPAGPAVATLDATEILAVTPLRLPDALSPPNWRRRVGYGRNWTVQQPDLDVAIPAERRQWLASEWRSAAWFDGTVRLRHLRATDPPMLETVLTEAADAQAVADALGALWGVRRQAFAVEIPLRTPDWDLGDVLQVTYPLGPFAAGALATVYGEAIAQDDGRITLKVLT